MEKSDISSPSLYTYRFRAMNTEVEVTLFGGKEDTAKLAELARSWFRSTEERFSRFRPDSELSHLNRLAGECCLVSNPMLEVLLLARSYADLTGGIFNPLILPALKGAGYDESFEKIGEQPLRQAKLPGNGPFAREGLSVDPVMKSLRLPPCAGMDLGGIVKSWAVKRLAAWFRSRWRVTRGCINAGGDLAVWGGADSADAWRIGIEHPWREQEETGLLLLAEGAAATSSKLGRRWNTNRGPMHHLIDPRTNLPSTGSVVQCTVAGPDAVECEIWAKVLCILELEEGYALFTRKTVGCEALVFTGDSRACFYGPRESLGRRWRGIRPDVFVRTGKGRETADWRGSL
jgi:thiamine biosynthesis lipoprotein